MKQIESLVDDIYALFKGPHICNEDNTQRLGHSIAGIIADRMRQDPYDARLRMSNIGTACERKLWYQVNDQEAAEELAPEVRIKFLFGDILEQLLLFWAEEAGHVVTGRQREIEIDGVLGHKDANIDGVPVDTKSASSISFSKFSKHLTPEEDKFGYLDQLGSYIYCSADDPDVSDHTRGAFLVIDKTLGKICLDIHQKTDKDYRDVIQRKRASITLQNPPARGYFEEDKGKSGNKGLGTECGYCGFKDKCWPNLRRFAYASGPEYLTKVVLLPKVPEIVR